MADLEQDWQIMVGGWAKAGVAEAGCLENIFFIGIFGHANF